MKRIFIATISVLYCAISLAYSQMTIEECQKKAAQVYPLAKQQALLQKLERLNQLIENTGYLPQLSISGSATYQSEVLQLPIRVLGIDKPSNDQYSAVAELSLTIWDGGVIHSRKKIAKASSEVDKQKYVVDMYSLNERVNQLFFGILLLKEQLKQNEILQNELQTNYERISVLTQNGMANQADVDEIRVEQLNAQQNRTTLAQTLQGYREMLSMMIAEPIDKNTTLVKPDWRNLTMNGDSISIYRPELGLFDAQAALFASQKSALFAGIRPKVTLFGQECVGRPGIAMFGNEFTNWWVAGVRLSWGLGGVYSLKPNINKIETIIELIKAQKKTFLFNSEQKAAQQKNEIKKYQELIKSDDEIIALRSNVKKAAEAKVENGTISVNDLIKEINAENLAIQEKSLHEIQLLMSIYNLKYTTNN